MKPPTDGCARYFKGDRYNNGCFGSFCDEWYTCGGPSLIMKKAPPEIEYKLEKLTSMMAEASRRLELANETAAEVSAMFYAAQKRDEDATAKLEESSKALSAAMEALRQSDEKLSQTNDKLRQSEDKLRQVVSLIEHIDGDTQTQMISLLSGISQSTLSSSSFLNTMSESTQQTASSTKQTADFLSGMPNSNSYIAETLSSLLTCVQGNI